ncbi:MAG: DUF222 domain-containing protein [Pseudonocardia sp.]
MPHQHHPPQPHLFTDQERARAAMLDFGGTLTPETLRMLACDAAVVPIVMNGLGQPLDVGRSKRTIPDGLRRAVAARDRGCAFPGCGRTVSWTGVFLVTCEHGRPARHPTCRTVCDQRGRYPHQPRSWGCSPQVVAHHGVS